MLPGGQFYARTMFNVSGGKFAVIALVAMIVLGPEKLPNAARQVGRFLRQFQQIRANLEAEVRNAVRLTEERPSRSESTTATPED